jgi:hypothetical protein
MLRLVHARIDGGHIVHGPRLPYDGLTFLVLTPVVHLRQNSRQVDQVLQRIRHEGQLVARVRLPNVLGRGAQRLIGDQVPPSEKALPRVIGEGSRL